MGFLSSLFSQKGSTKPEDYQSIFVKWDRHGKEYGPLQFADLILRDWSGPPRWARFDGEKRWRDYSYFLKTIDRLGASQEQIAFLADQGIETDEATLGFKEALQLVERRREELREIRAAERKEKEKLPATKYTRKKMDKCGVEYPEDVTRAQAKKLLADYEDVQQFRKLVRKLAKRGVSVPDSVLSGQGGESLRDGMSIIDHLETLPDLLDQLGELRVEYSVPDEINLRTVSMFNRRVEAAIDEAEDAEDQIKDRELFASDDEYRVVGKFPKKQMDAVKKEIIEKALQGRWSFERDILACIETHLPDVRLRVVDY